MAILPYLKLAITHPSEMRAVCNFKIWRDPLNDIYEHPETSGVKRPSMIRCWELLDLTSRSFAMVVKELQGDLCRAVCIFYLVLRALDTVEDDMTLDINTKVETLRTFHQKLQLPGWTFNQSGPNEKDRVVLVEFDKIIEEFQLLDAKYQQVISTICQKMGFGMAHYAQQAHDHNNVFSLETYEDFDLYCHYVAGLVGEGLSMLFSASDLERAELGLQLTLSNSMGLLLQKLNITRDFKEDVDDGRLFWPKAIWGKYVADPKDLCKPENALKARHALSEMALDVLQHAVDSLEYLTLLRNQSVFAFCAIPQVMAIATLDECFANPEVFQRNVKIRKTYALSLMMQTTNPKAVGEIYLKHLKSIHSKLRADDPSFIKICSSIGRVQQWMENRYPTWIVFGKAVPTSYTQAKNMRLTDNRIRQLPILAPKSAYGQPADQTMQILLFAGITCVIISVLMGAPVLVYLGYATNAEGQPIINYREIFSPTKMLGYLHSAPQKVAQQLSQKTEL